MPSPVCVRFSEKELQVLDKYALSRKMNRSNALREIVLSKAIEPLKDDVWMIKAFNIFGITSSQLKYAMTQKSLSTMLGYIQDKCKEMSIMALGENIIVSIMKNDTKCVSKIYASMSNADALEQICIDIESQMVKAFMEA